MKHIFETLKVLIFTLFGIALTVIVYQALNRLNVKDDRQTYLVYAAFDDLKQLQIGDDVRLAGVRIGSVTDASLQNNLAVATLSIDKKFSVPSDSVATISMAGLLGANYIAIIPGNSRNPLQPNETLQTQNPLDVGAVLQKFGSVGERLDRILANFDGKDIGDNLFGDRCSERDPRLCRLRCRLRLYVYGLWCRLPAHLRLLRIHSLNIYGLRCRLHGLLI